LIGNGVPVAEEAPMDPRESDVVSPSHPRRTGSGWLVVLFTIVCWSCVDSGQDEPNTGSIAQLARDSAGVRIVENTSPSWNDEDAWRLGDAAVIDIGASGGDPKYELYRVRDVLGMPDGRIVIANGGPIELRFYGADGEFLMAAGGEGEGPGEFRSFRWIGLQGDSIVVYDWRLSRVSVFDTYGRFQRSVTVVSVGNVPVRVVGLFGDGSILSYGSPLSEVRGVYREQNIVFDHGSDGKTVDSLGTFPGSETFVRDLNPGPVMSGTPYFHRSSAYLVSNEHFYVATNDTYEIGVYSRTGDLVSLIRRQVTHLPVTAEAVSYEREHFVGMRGPHPMRPQLEQFADAKPIPATLPAYSAVKHDESGNLWVEEYRYPGDQLSRWTVFDVDGVMLGIIQMPTGFSMLYAGENFVLGSWQDELDVDHIQRYELIKP